MSKYSIQNECLEMIEAFTDEQYESELAVIESVIDIFDKAVLMMELSNHSINLPDCSMFMESTFIQEVDDPPADGDGNSNPAQTDNNTADNNAGDNKDQNTNTDTNNNNNTDNKVSKEDYNKEHHFRRMNDKGDIEHILWSILAFIPRLFSLPIKLIINAVKEKKNKKANENVKNATPEEKKVVGEAIKKDEGKTSGNTAIKDGEIVASATVHDGGDNQVVVSINSNGDIGANIDYDATSNIADKIFDMLANAYGKPEALTTPQPVQLGDIDALEKEREEANKRHAEQRQRESLEAFEGKRGQVLAALEKRLKELQDTKTTIENTIKQLQAPNALKGIDLSQVVEARKTDLKNIKRIIQLAKKYINEVNAADAVSDLVLNTYSGYLESMRNAAKEATAKADQNSVALDQNQQDMNRGANPSTPFDINPVSYNSGNNNQNNGGGNQ